jgi:two-component system, NtrC family, sensor kinase
MRRRSTASGQPAKSRRRKTVTLKRRNAPKVAHHRESSATGLNKKVALFKRERDEALEQLSEALEQQTATSEVLRVIARSPTDAQPAFEAMVARAARLCEADFSAVARFENGLLHLVAMNNLSLAERDAFDSLFPRPPERNFAMGRAFIDGVSVHSPIQLMIRARARCCSARSAIGPLWRFPSFETGSQSVRSGADGGR